MLQGSVNKVDGLNSARGLYSFNGKSSAFFQGLTTFFYSGIGAAAIPARLMLRKNFGERAFSPMAVLISVCFYIYLTFNVFLLGLSDIDDEGFPVLGAVGMFIFVLIPFNSFTFFIIKIIRKAYKHFKNIYSNKEHDTYKYSYYRGEPIYHKYADKIGTQIFGYKVDEKLIRIYFEPKGFALKHLAIGLVSLVISILIIVFVIAGFIGGTEALLILAIPTVLLYAYSISNLCLSISGFCLLLEELAIAKKIRDSVLDIYDGEYDMQFILKQKELLQNKNIENESLDIAEDIFQNTEFSGSASFPVYNKAVNQDEEKEDDSEIAALNTPLQNQKEESVVSKKKLTKTFPKKEGADLDNFMTKILE